MNLTILFRIAAVFATAIAIAACGSKPPGCSDAETLATVKGLIVDNTSKYLKDEKKLADDPDGWMRKFFDGLKVEISGIVSDGYKSEARKQLCKGSMKITPVTGVVAERAIEYSTQKTEGPKGEFLLEIQDVAPFVVATGLQAKKYFLANRWNGTWNGTYSCSGVNGATEGAQGPYSMPASMVTQGTKAKLERTTRGGGIEILEGDFDEFGITDTFALNGEGKNSPEDRWKTSFVGNVTGKNLLATGKISVGGEVLRQCQLNLTLGAS